MDETSSTAMSREEISQLKSSHLKKKRKKATNITSSGQSSRNILNFEWNEGDDTSYDCNPLYQPKSRTLLAKRVGFKVSNHLQRSLSPIR